MYAQFHTGPEVSAVAVAASMAFFLFFSLSFTTFLWRLEYPSLPKPGLVDGRYSGSSLSILLLMPHALQSVPGPSGPIRHCGVSEVPQWLHLLSFLTCRLRWRPTTRRW